MKRRLIITTTCVVCFIFCTINLFSTNVFVANKSDSIILGNNSIQVSFSNTDAYKMQSIVMNSRELMPAGVTDVHPWELIYQGPNGENPLLKPHNGFYKGVVVKESSNSITLIFTWQMVLTAESTHAVRMMVTLNTDSELLEWDIEADLPEGWIISNVDFPRVPVLRLENAKAILPAGWGAEYQLNENTTISSRYPSGTGTMQLVLMHDGKECFYYATRDMSASDKRFKIDSSGKSVLFHTQITTSEAWSTEGKGTFKLPWTTVTGYCREGWESAVTKWYRPFTYTTIWGSTSLHSRNLPDWIYDTDVWLRPMNVNNDVMEAIRKAILIYGRGVGLHWYYWHNYPHDSKYPEYFPSKEGFVEMVKETIQLGGHVTPYINGRLWDPATESYQNRGGKFASCRKQDGTLYSEVYSSRVINTVTCPASSIWQEIQRDIIWRIQEEIGTSGVYVDQAAAAPAEPCWADNHGHPKGGGEFWVQAYRDLYKNIRTKYLKHGNILTSEENAECYIDLFDMLLIVNSPLRTSNVVPLFPLVYSDRVITSGFAYTPFDLTTGAFRYLNMMSLLWGAQLGWVDPVVLVNDNCREEAEFLKDMMLFRKKQHEFVIGGQFIREIIPEGDNPVRAYPGYGRSHIIRGAEWKSSKSEKKAIFLVNIDDEDHVIFIGNGKEIKMRGKQCICLDVW